MRTATLVESTRRSRSRGVKRRTVPSCGQNGTNRLFRRRHPPVRAPREGAGRRVASERGPLPQRVDATGQPVGPLARSSALAWAAGACLGLPAEKKTVSPIASAARGPGVFRVPPGRPQAPLDRDARSHFPRPTGPRRSSRRVVVSRLVLNRKRRAVPFRHERGPTVSHRRRHPVARPTRLSRPDHVRAPGRGPAQHHRGEHGAGPVHPSSLQSPPHPGQSARAGRGTWRHASS